MTFTVLGKNINRVTDHDGECKSPVPGPYDVDVTSSSKVGFKVTTRVRLCGYLPEDPEVVM